MVTRNNYGKIYRKENKYVDSIFHITSRNNVMYDINSSPLVPHMFASVSGQQCIR